MGLSYLLMSGLHGSSGERSQPLAVDSGDTDPTYRPMLTPLVNWLNSGAGKV